MYFGSVKFFRHLILTVVFGWIGVATVLAVFFGIKCHMLEKDRDTQSLTIEEHISQMNADGYTAEEIEAVLRRTEGLGSGENAQVIRPEGGSDDDAVPAAAVTEQGGQGAQNEQDGQDGQDISAPAADGNIPTGSGEGTADSGVEAADIPTGDYSSLYTQMYVQKPAASPAADNTVFLTFEGDPSGNMSDILIILNRQNSRAAFLTGSGGSSEEASDILRRAHDTGNTVGVLAGSGREYASAAEYLADFAAAFDEISAVCGEAPYLYRIPDSAAMSDQIRREVQAELDRRGFVNCPYTSAPDDTSDSVGWQELYDDMSAEIERCCSRDKYCVIKLHGGRENFLTVCTAEDVILDRRAEGYIFAAFDGSVLAQ